MEAESGLWNVFSNKNYNMDNWLLYYYTNVTSIWILLVTFLLKYSKLQINHKQNNGGISVTETFQPTS